MQTSFLPGLYIRWKSKKTEVKAHEARAQPEIVILASWLLFPENANDARGAEGFAGFICVCFLPTLYPGLLWTSLCRSSLEAPPASLPWVLRLKA